MGTSAEGRYATPLCSAVRVYVCTRVARIRGCKAVKRICHLVSLDKLLFLRETPLLRLTSSRTGFASPRRQDSNPHSPARSRNRNPPPLLPDFLCSRRIKREICEFARGIPVICEEESGKLDFVFNPSECWICRTLHELPGEETLSRETHVILPELCATSSSPPSPAVPHGL